MNSQDLQPGDVIVCRDGESRSVTRVDVRLTVTTPVCNLTIRDHHTYAVGALAVLAHNMGWCDILKIAERKKPEKLSEYMRKNGIADRLMHGHHIVQKTVNMKMWSKVKNLSEAEMLTKFGDNQSYKATWYIGKSQELLKNIGKGSLLGDKSATRLLAQSGKELYNLCWAVNGDRGIHSAEYCAAVWKRLNDAWLLDGADGLRDALLEMRKIFERGDVFWP